MDFTTPWINLLAAILTISAPIVTFILQRRAQARCEKNPNFSNDTKNYAIYQYKIGLFTGFAFVNVMNIFHPFLVPIRRMLGGEQYESASIIFADIVFSGIFLNLFILCFAVLIGYSLKVAYHHGFRWIK